MNKKHEEVKNYYGKELQKSEDLKTNACCTLEAPAIHIQNALRNVHDDVQAKYYGCGLTIPTTLKGLRVLDLGSGSGRDCYIAAQLVGETGHVVGVDMTDEQLAVANEYKEYHREKFGYKKSNVTFLKGNIEKLDELNLDLESFDLIISNCVINLANNKLKVLKDVYSLLKPGGEMYFSDVYSDRRVPENLQNDPVLWGECLSGALYWNDFLNISKGAGFADPRNVESKEITIGNEDLIKKVDGIEFFSVTYRLFKIKSLEPDCEDYGHTVTYKGTMSENNKFFKLDDHHVFMKGEAQKVCGNSYSMIVDSRLKEFFEYDGSFEKHLGIFEGCGASSPFTNVSGLACC